MAKAKEATTESTAEQATRGLQKTREGIVTSDKMDKSITVSVTRKTKHPVYGKYVKSTKKYMAHDETNQCGIGDRVLIAEARPLSKKKRWRLKSVIEKAV